MNKNNKEKEFSYTEAINELDMLVQSVENRDTDMDSLMSKAKRAVELIKLCRKNLTETNEQLDLIFKELNSADNN